MKTQLEIIFMFSIHSVTTTLEDLHPLIEQSFIFKRQRIRHTINRGDLANFQEGDFVLVARDNFHKGKKG